LTRGETFSGETVNYRKDGSEYYVEWDITPIRTSGGQISHFLSIQRNVTARKLAENQLRDMFQQVDKSRNDLLSILNELRIGTVMTALRFQFAANNSAWGPPSAARCSRCRAARRHPRNPTGFLKALQTKRSPTTVPRVWRMKELVEQLPNERYPAAKRVQC
jgi:hypothetical protein